jgi:periplasmic protein TonB
MSQTMKRSDPSHINEPLDADEGSGMRRFIFPVVMVLVFVAAGWLIYSNLSGGSKKPARQTVKIAVLPDTPPPPPPPPKEEKKPDPEQKQDKPQQEQPKQVEAPPEPQQLKMEGPAGDGPSAFSSGNITSDYKGGAIGAGTGGTLADRMASNNFGNAAKRELNEFLNRDQALRRGGEFKLPVLLWVRADGSIERSSLEASSGNNDVDAALRLALSTFRGFRNPPPAGLPQPIRLQVTNRMSG